MSIPADDLSRQIAFIKEIDKLKYIQRRTKLFAGDRHENDAEHSWHLAMMTIVLSAHADTPVDVLKVIKMVLIHDIVEIDAGDVLYDAQQSHTNTDNERLAAERIFGLLPPRQAEELIAIWEEFEAGLTAEAKFARSMDRLEPLLQNTANNGGTWKKEFDVDYEKVYNKKKAIQHGSALLWQFAENLIDESVERDIEKAIKSRLQWPDCSMV